MAIGRLFDWDATHTRVTNAKGLLLAALTCAVMLFGANAAAQQVEVAFELPAINTADYNKPYVAIWLERSDRNEALLLWHLNERSDDKWLPDIRRWWRKLGRYGQPVDGITGATRGPGRYREAFDVRIDEPVTLLIEVVREDGGRSLLRQRLDDSDDPQSYELPADQEISAITITVGVP